jgi:DNA-binding LacI/PurR family transcriptional regulator
MNGSKTADLLVDIIRHGRGKTSHIKMLPEFVPGDTCALGHAKVI